MSRLRYARRRDAAEPAIVEALEHIGCQVERLEELCDLLVRYRQRFFLLEVKTPGKSRDKRQTAQEAFCAAWNVPYVRTPEQAINAVAGSVGGRIVDFEVHPILARDRAS